MNSLRGHLLVASPHLPDSNFAQTVVLVLQHDENGALGVVLNRPSDNTIKDVWEQVAESPCDVEEPLFMGGPLVGPVIAVHTQEEFSQQQVTNHLYFSMQRENLADLVADGRPKLKIFSGYSGWGEGQLEDELDNGAWLTVPAKVEYVFASDADLWRKVVQDISNDMLTSVLKIKHIPDDVSLN